MAGHPSCPKFLNNDPSFFTRAVHAGFEPREYENMPLVPPLTLATNFMQPGPDTRGAFFYGRLDNPSRRAVERSLASLEEAQHATAFSSGTAAIAAVVQMLRAGDHVVASQHLYSGTWGYFTNLASRQGINVDLVDCRDSAIVAKSLQPRTRLVWVESPSNPTLQVVDLAQLAAVVRHHNDALGGDLQPHGPDVPSSAVGKGVFLVVDNTFLSPYFQRPLLLGADLVVHSCTKYLNGSTDVVMGTVCTNSPALHRQLVLLQGSAGAIPSPFDCYQLQRSLRTLPLRMQRHMENGLAVAVFLETHPCVRRVLHPALPSHPQHELTLRQTFGHSGMVSFYLKEDDLDKARAFLQALRVVTLSSSLGGAESLAELPLTMSHAGVPPEENSRSGITAGLIRLSVGLEDEQDITRDLDQALNQAFLV